jgi:hypothetical protein
MICYLSCQLQAAGPGRDEEDDEEEQEADDVVAGVVVDELGLAVDVVRPYRRLPGGRGLVTSVIDGLLVSGAGGGVRAQAGRAVLVGEAWIPPSSVRTEYSKPGGVASGTAPRASRSWPRCVRC